MYPWWFFTTFVPGSFRFGLTSATSVVVVVGGEGSLFRNNDTACAGATSRREAEVIPKQCPLPPATKPVPLKGSLPPCEICKHRRFWSDSEWVSCDDCLVCCDSFEHGTTSEICHQQAHDIMLKPYRDES
jgi:hypothetical protein